ncbi:MAG: acyl-CoA thioesterase [Lentisphaerae bacterium]|nr:acyl-CoA thioesterase [Lentisphaerota bacterium]
MATAAGKSFQYALHVPYAHTDQMRVVYYANYLVYFEMARAAMLREVGLPYSEMEKNGLSLPVIEAHCVYKAPARYDDELKVVSRCAFQGPCLRVSYEVWRGRTVIVTGYTIHVGLSAEGKIRRTLPELRRLVEQEG